MIRRNGSLSALTLQFDLKRRFRCACRPEAFSKLDFNEFDVVLLTINCVCQKIYQQYILFTHRDVISDTLQYFWSEHICQNFRHWKRFRTNTQSSYNDLQISVVLEVI